MQVESSPSMRPPPRRRRGRLGPCLGRPPPDDNVEESSFHTGVKESNVKTVKGPSLRREEPRRTWGGGAYCLEGADDMALHPSVSGVSVAATRKATWAHVVPKRPSPQRMDGVHGFL